MTVCIATIYGRLNDYSNGNNSKDEYGIVVTSDRMVSYERGAFTYEGKAKKIKFDRPNENVKFAMMGTGAVNYIEDFFRRFHKEDLSKSRHIEDIAKVGAEVSGTMAKDSIETSFLHPLSLDWKKLYQNGSKVPDSIAAFITDGLKETGGDFQEGLHLLVAGLDETGPHIFLVEDFDYTEVGTLGYHAIGMGDRAARVSLESNGYTPFSNRYESILLSLIAKFYAEKAFGVGRDTDCCVLRNNMLAEDWLEVKDINSIRDLYEGEMIPSFTKLIGKNSNKIEDILLKRG